MAAIVVELPNLVGVRLAVDVRDGRVSRSVIAVMLAAVTAHSA
jgi:hypothetical protein